jgi:hypothetical protein
MLADFSFDGDGDDRFGDLLLHHDFPGGLVSGVALFHLH